MLTAKPDTVRRRCEAVAESLDAANIDVDVVDTVASVGAGAFPTHEISSAGLAFAGDAVTLERRLRAGAPPVIGRITDDRLVLDLRSVPAAHDTALTEAILSALA
jgi:L-seryl-tRNA(Ser) seleniumtransferase